MAKGKKSGTLGRNEFLFTGRKFQVPIPDTGLDDLKNHRANEKVFKIQACWNSFRIFHSYNAIVDPTVDCLALVKKSIAIKAAKYQVTDIIPLKGWKDGVVVFAGLKVEDNEQDDIPMLIADLQWDMVLGRKWLEKSSARLKNGNLVWLDDSSDEHQEFTDQLPAKEDTEDECLHSNIRQEGRMADDLITISTPETPKEIPIHKKLVEPAELGGEAVKQKNVSVTTLPFLETKEDLSACQGKNDTLPPEGVTIPSHKSREDLEVSESRIFEVPDKLCNKCLFCPGDEEDCLDGQDFYRSRVPIANDDQCLPPVVRLPEMDSFRFFRSISCFSSGTPVAIMATSKNQIVADEDMIAVGPVVVRLPGRQDVELSLSPSPSPSDVQKAEEDTEGIDTKWSCLCLLSIDPVEETCLAEAAWNEEIAEPNNHHEDRNSDGVSGKTNGLDNASDCERDKLVKEMDLDYELVGNPESSDWTLERYQRTNLLDRICYGILATRPAGEKVSSLGKLLFRFPPTTLVNTVDSTCDSRQTVSTWKDTGWSSQFLRMQYSKYALRFLRTTFPREQGPLFSSMTAWFETLLDLSYRLVPLLDTG
jgi:hypothetical protein